MGRPPTATRKDVEAATIDAAARPLHSASVTWQVALASPAFASGLSVQSWQTKVTAIVRHGRDSSTAARLQEVRRKEGARRSGARARASQACCQSALDKLAFALIIDFKSSKVAYANEACACAQRRTSYRQHSRGRGQAVRNADTRLHRAPLNL
jgi:hypothetical protein